MEFQIDVLLRGQERATTGVITAVDREPAGWTDADVAVVLKEMLRAIDRLRNPGQPERDVFLRGVSWIVELYHEGGVVIAIEISTGAAVAGPFAIGQHDLEAMIGRVLATGARGAPVVH